MTKKTLTFAIIIYSTLAHTALAAGIQVSPAKMDISVQSAAKASATITIANPTTDVQLFTIAADDFGEAITANPSSITLQAGDRHEIMIAIDGQKLPKNSGALYATNLSVISRPLADNRVKVGTGVKIPLIVRVTDAKAPLPRGTILLGLAGVMLLVIVFAFFFGRKKT